MSEEGAQHRFEIFVDEESKEVLFTVATRVPDTSAYVTPFGFSVGDTILLSVAVGFQPFHIRQKNYVFIPSEQDGQAMRNFGAIYYCHLQGITDIPALSDSKFSASIYGPDREDGPGTEG